MEQIKAEPGHCYWIKTPPKGAHFFVVVLAISEERHLLFPFTTKRERSDPSFEITPDRSDCPDFIQHETVIAYQHGREMVNLSLADGISRGLVSFSGMLCTEILLEILSAGLNSKFTRNKWKPLIREEIERIEQRQLGEVNPTEDS